MATYHGIFANGVVVVLNEVDDGVFANGTPKFDRKVAAAAATNVTPASIASGEGHSNTAMMRGTIQSEV